MCQSLTYVQALQRAGAAPFLIPHMPDAGALRALFARLDGLLLPGGGDVDPAQYGESRHDKCGEPSAARDGTELNLARWAVEAGLPLLAICRGIQVLNVALGGTLYQDIEAQVPGAGRHDWHGAHARTLTPHDVTLMPGSRIAALSGLHTMPVNSLHHQAIKDPGKDLRVVGRDLDEITQAVECVEGQTILGVQWHPEYLLYLPSQFALFRWLLRRAT